MVEFAEFAAFFSAAIAAGVVVGIFAQLTKTRG